MAVIEPIVAIVGAGAAGVRAAETLARGGVRPILFDEGERPGGQIYRQPPRGAGRRRGRAVRARGGEGRRDPPRAAGPRRPGRLPAADACLERLPEPARSPRAGWLR